MSKTINLISLGEIQQLVAEEKTFVLNVIAAWCSDCTEQQAPFIPSFAQNVQHQGIQFFQLLAQESKDQYLDNGIAEFVESIWGHGFPRTLLIDKGKPTAINQIELINQQQLQHFSQQVKAVIQRD